MALSKLSEDQHRSVFGHLCNNVLEPRDAVDFSSASNGLRTATQELLQQLRVDHEVPAALCRMLRLRSCKELREAKEVYGGNFRLTAAQLTLFGKLGSKLPALQKLVLSERVVYTAFAYDPLLRLVRRIDNPPPTARFDGALLWAAGLIAGALPALEELALACLRIGDAGASEARSGGRSPMCFPFCCLYIKLPAFVF